VNILFLDQFSEIGGGQRVLLDVVDGAAMRGWKAHVLVPGNGPLVAQLRGRNVPVDHIPCGPYRSGGKSPADFLRFGLDMRQQVRQIDNLLRQERFDLVYVNGPRLLSAASRAARGRAPVLFHAHSRIQQAYAVRAAGSSIRKVDATVVACSEWAAQLLRPYVAPGKLHVIPNGTPDLGFRERLFSRNMNWTIGVVGRISPEKGHMEFLRAVALLKPEFPRVRFELCGAASLSARKYFDGVQALARDLNVELLGWREDIASIFSELDLLVVPSKEEAMGRVLVEAFAAGVPVVAFAVGGIPEVVTDGETGFLVRGDGPQALAARIRELLNGDAEILRRVSRNARRAWEDRYTVTAYQERIANLMTQVVSDHVGEDGILRRIVNPP
jgi:glycosyltransferase involved in cell wall biosynthesis